MVFASEDKYEGKGTLIRADKSRYDGDFKGGLFHGKGVLETAEGDGSICDGNP